MIIKVQRTGPVEVPLPKYQTEGAAGFDLHAAIEDPIILYPKNHLHGGVESDFPNWKLISTGLIFEIPPNYEGQIRPRSGIALKHGISIVNSPGTIDSDYRSVVGVIIINFGTEAFVINPLDRIAQMVISPVVQVELVFSDELTETKRGEGGFGSTA